MRLRDALVASHEECSIERMLIETLAGPSTDRLDEVFIEECRAALVAIDKLKISGQYEGERARLAELLNSRRAQLETDMRAKMDQAMQRDSFREIVDSLQNYIDGLLSPDLAQRARFQRLRDKEGLNNRSAADAVHLLAVLEPAKHAKGRPSASPPWVNESAILDQMRLAVAGGLTVIEASRQSAAHEGKIHAASRASYFARLFRARVALRN